MTVSEVLRLKLHLPFKRVFDDKDYDNKNNNNNINDNNNNICLTIITSIRYYVQRDRDFAYINKIDFRYS